MILFGISLIIDITLHRIYISTSSILLTVKCFWIYPKGRAVWFPQVFLTV